MMMVLKLSVMVFLIYMGDFQSCLTRDGWCLLQICGLIVQSDQGEECLCITGKKKTSVFAVSFLSFKMFTDWCVCVCGKIIVHSVGLDCGYYYICFQVVSFEVWLLMPA